MITDLAYLFVVSLLISVATFGGGSQALFYQYGVLQTHWITRTDLSAVLAFGYATPGPGIWSGYVHWLSDRRACRCCRWHCRHIFSAICRGARRLTLLEPFAAKPTSRNVRQGCWISGDRSCCRYGIRSRSSCHHNSMADYYRCRLISRYCPLESKPALYNRRRWTNRLNNVRSLCNISFLTIFR